MCLEPRYSVSGRSNEQITSTTNETQCNHQMSSDKDVEGVSVTASMKYFTFHFVTPDSRGHEASAVSRLQLARRFSSGRDTPGSGIRVDVL